MEKLQDVLSNALIEKWSFPSSHFIESVDRHYEPVRPFTVSVIGDMFRRAQAAKRRQATPTGNLPKPSEKLVAKPILYWLVSVRDPIASVIADTRDAYNISTNSMLNHKSAEIASRLDTVPDQKIQDMGGGAIKKKRPASVQDAILELKDPACDVRTAGRWAAVAVCVALDVGLVVETDEFPDVICWNRDIAWINATGGFTRMSESEAAREIRDLSASLINSDAPAMSRLKSACACLKVAKPFKRSRTGMINDIRDRIKAMSKE